MTVRFPWEYRPPGWRGEPGNTGLCTDEQVAAALAKSASMEHDQVVLTEIDGCKAIVITDLNTGDTWTYIKKYG